MWAVSKVLLNTLTFAQFMAIQFQLFPLSQHPPENWLWSILHSSVVSGLCGRLPWGREIIEIRTSTNSVVCVLKRTVGHQSL